MDSNSFWSRLRQRWSNDLDLAQFEAAGLGAFAQPTILIQIKRALAPPWQLERKSQTTVSGGVSWRSAQRMAT
jgi:hypothetical protein